MTRLEYLNFEEAEQSNTEVTHASDDDGELNNRRESIIDLSQVPIKTVKSKNVSAEMVLKKVDLKCKQIQQWLKKMAELDLRK